MRAAGRSLGLLLPAGALLAVACQLWAPAEPAAPERELTLCERPARPAATLQEPQIEGSFRAFANEWLARMRKVGAAQGRRILDAFETELRPTGSAKAPWVGVLRYCEQTPSKRTVVSEIFRYQAGEWVY
jgi:hypothetical protein